MKKNILTLLFTFLIVSNIAVAADKIKQIKVNGNHRIETSTILSYISVKNGDEIQSTTLDKSLKRLFDTGFFVDVDFDIVGSSLIINVKENPIVSEIYFDGNDRLEDDVLLSSVTLKSRSIYTKAKVQKDAMRIVEAYRRLGRYGVTVEPKIIERSQNRIDLVFEINEGPATYINKINFVGNKQYSADDLKDVMITKENRWYNFLATTDTYDPDRLNYDKEMIRRFYLKNGYVDVKILSANAELTPDKKSFFITIKIDEGKRFKYGNVKINSKIKAINVKEMMSSLEIKKGQYYNIDKIELGSQNLVDDLGSYGFAFVDVTPRFTKNDETQTIDVTYDIQEGRKVYVNRININGNTRTEDKVIRREMKLSEGDAFNTAKYKRSRHNIDNLGYFSNVSVNPDNIGADKMDINIDVEETSTGSLTFGVGWSTYNGALIELGLQERNFLGKGLITKIQGTLAMEGTEYDISITDPYFLDKNLSAGVDVFYTTQDVQDESSYDLDTAGGALRLGWKYTDDLRHNVRYIYKREDVTNIDNDASIYIKDRAGRTTLSAFSHTLMYDKRDNQFDPTNGYLLTLSNEYAGIGGSEHFFKTDIGAGYYYPVTNSITFELKGKGGYNIPLDGDDIGLGYRYYLGGQEIRGFANYGIGARDAISDDALGGNWFWSATAQLSFPVGLPSELGIKGRVFTDFGMIGEPDDTGGYDILYNNTLRSSIGFGIGWASPLGMISVDIAHALTKEDYDETEIVKLTFGTGF